MLYYVKGVNIRNIWLVPPSTTEFVHRVWIRDENQLWVTV